MEAVCFICGRSLGYFGNSKINGGEICGACTKNIPFIFSEILPGLTVNNIRSLYVYKAGLKKKKIEPTASYGRLSIDESNGLLLLNKKGNSVSDTTVFIDIKDVSELSIYVTNPKVGKDNKVSADVELCLTFNEHLFGLTCKTKIASGVSCFSKKIDKTHLDWDEPGDLSLFRNMINQMARNESEKLQRRLRGYVTKEDVDRYKARCTFLLGETYTDKEIDEKRNRLLAVFGDDEAAIDKIDYYYRLLKEENK